MSRLLLRARLKLHRASGLAARRLSRSSARNQRYRSTTQRNAVILGSHLYPLSLLVYGAELENITCLGFDHWLVSTVGRKLSLIGSSPFSSDEEVLEFFRGVIRLRGVTGDQSITDASPIAEANIGSVIRLCVAKRPGRVGQIRCQGCDPRPRSLQGSRSC